MNELTDNTNPVNNPKQAVAEFVGEQFIDWLMGYISNQMQSWPQILTLKTAHLKPEKIKKYMLQRFLADEAFLGAREQDPGFLRFAIANLSESDDPQAENALEILEKKLEDELAGEYRELWLRLLHALGTADDELARAEPKEVTRNYIAELSEVYSTSEWQTAVGAFVTQQQAVNEEYQAMLSMLRNNFMLSDKDLELLISRTGSEKKYVVNTNHILDKIVFDPAAKLLLWEGVKRQLQIRQDFLTGLSKYITA